jgi:hypothetical protein
MVFNQLRPELIAAIRSYLERNDLMNLESEIIMCCETTSTKRHKGFFDGLLGGDPDPVHYTGILITPTWLIWARSGAKYGTAVSSARMSEIEPPKTDLRLQQMGIKAEQDGVSIFGFINGSTERVSAFIGLGPEPVAQKFRSVLRDLIAKAR